MFQSDPIIAALKRGKTRGITPTPACQGAGAFAELGPGLCSLGRMFPDTLITAQESAEVLGVCVDHTRRLIRERKLKATRRCNRHVLKLADVLDARLGVLGEKGVASEDLEHHHPPGDLAVREEADRGLRVVRRPQMHRRRIEECDSAERTLRLVFTSCRPSSTSSSASRRRRARRRQGGDRDVRDGRLDPRLPQHRGRRWTIRRLDTGLTDADREVVFNAMEGARRELCRLAVGRAARRARPA